MSVVDKFNSLLGKQVTKKQILALIEEARNEEQFAIVERLQSVLLSNPKDSKLRFSKLSAPAIEVVPESFIRCLDCLEDTDENIIGLGKAVSPNEIYQMITDKMIDKIKEANSSDYKRKWKSGIFDTTGYTIPFNFVSKNRYRGINVILLTELEPMANPFFLTFKQIEDLGGRLRKGSKGFPVVYFTLLYKYVDADKKVDIASYDLKKYIQLLKDNKKHIPEFQNGFTAEEIAQMHKLPILKYYNVFNGVDIDGIDFDLDNFKNGFIEQPITTDSEEKMPIPEAIVTHYPSPQPGLKFGGDRAFYSPTNDSVTLPHFKSFETAQDYYRTLFHEFAHSTGHPDRLERDFSGSFGSKKYAFEELVAEFAATFLCAEAGILWHTNTNHPAYLKSWNAALTHLEDDNRFLMRAATEAQKAADFILQIDKNGEPKYYNDLKKITAAKPKVTVTKKKASTKKGPASTNAKTPIKPLVKSVVKNTQDKPRVNRKRTISSNKKLENSNKQFDLFGLNGRKKQTGLKAAAIENIEVVAEVVNPVIETVPAVPQPRPGSIAHRLQQKQNVVREYYRIDNQEISDFLGRIEKKNQRECSYYHDWRARKR
ncbi:DUF1738 domain-containing protein [Flavobacterium alkalisoli]|uniref:DUF1738 domain-containing protein n=1 Tax=Flavobacterium alkalisoli TaxID=2602769 RepID=A0A5B9FRW2_9FLAO|nr:zincin-like metallopeptidase domain-containing protein [Flavobacterium alkalisoli]QEE49634.1 DUF1738 domain-containing protein [Flavobacterium alkalisoli]